MENLRRLQSLVLRLIIFLVWFDFMCFSLILAGQIFKWSFFNDAVGGAFFTTFGLSLGALAALAVLHIVLTLSIVSNSMSLLVREKEVINEEVSQRERKRFTALVVVSLIGIVLIAGYQGIVERNAARYKVKKIEIQLKDVAQSTLAMHIADLIDNNESINKLYFARDEILLSLEGNRGVTLLIPKTGEQGQLFYKITPWDYDSDDEKIISKSLEHLFVPDSIEKKQFKQVVDKNKPFTIVKRYGIRSFYPVIENGQLKLILLLDTGRNINSDYLMSRSSKFGG